MKGNFKIIIVDLDKQENILEEYCDELVYSINRPLKHEYFPGSYQAIGFRQDGPVTFEISAKDTKNDGKMV